MERYIGRENELRILNAQWNSPGFSFGVLYGRRRVGKTSLLMHFLEGRKAIFLQSTKDRDYNLQKLSSSIGELFFGASGIQPYTSFASALSVIAEHGRNERIALVIDEVSYLAESDGTILSVLQSFVDQEFRDTQILLILCGSNMSFMEKDILGVGSPVYGRRTFQMKLMPFPISETASMLPAWTEEDIASAHAITEGIPYYISFLGEHESIEEAIRKEFFTPGGRLYTEGRLYLMMELRNMELYDRILGLMAAGVHEVTMIADKSGKDKSSVSQALQKLASLGIVKSRRKIAGRGLNRGWDFRDGYFAFFYEYVFPYSDLIEIGAGSAVADRAIAGLPAFTGKAMEKVFQKHILLNSGYPIREIGNVEFPDKENHRNEEIDLVADAGEAMIFGECKWRSAPVGMDVYDELVRKSILAYPSAAKRVFCILSRSGFKDDLKALAENSDGSIMLIDGITLIRG